MIHCDVSVQLETWSVFSRQSPFPVHTSHRFPPVLVQTKCDQQYIWQ